MINYRNLGGLLLDNELINRSVLIVRVHIILHLRISNLNSVVGTKMRSENILICIQRLKLQGGHSVCGAIYSDTVLSILPFPIKSRSFYHETLLKPFHSS